jgi:hypothetical protein
MRFANASLFCLLGLALPVAAQQQEPRPARNAPIYRITVVQRSITAINYGNQSEPSRIDFKGTVLEPKARGEATVENAQGAVKIKAKFERLEAPGSFGPRFLTYVLWAITPDGKANNLGEIVTDAHDRARLSVTTHLQAFGLIVTAEPYFAVAEPSDLVVAENIPRPETEGQVEEVQAKYQLLPRGSYTLNLGEPASTPSGPLVSQDEYNAILAIYEAQNAIQIARSLHADLYAPDVLSTAEALLDRARAANAQKGNTKAAVTTAREAAERAEDARLIAVKKTEARRAAQQAPAAE